MSSIFVTSAQACSDKYFVQCTSGPNLGQWMCKLCSSRTFKDKVRHSKLMTHIDRVRLDLERRNVSGPTVAPPGLGSRSSLGDKAGAPPQVFPDNGDVEIETTPYGLENTSVTHDLHMSDVFDNDDDELESLYEPSLLWNEGDDPKSGQSSIDLDAFLEECSDHESSTGPMPENDTTAITDSLLPWYPLRKKEHSAALLLMGTGRNLMSTAEYNCLRCILKMVINVHLPELGHLKDIRKELKARLGLRVLEKTSPLGNPCFTLSVTDIISQELSNPEVAGHLEFLPKNNKDVTVDRYSQSKKWREDLPPCLRVPMVDIDSEHFYIYEPTQLEDSRVVVPVFFYKDKLDVRAKCLEMVCIGTHEFLIAEESKFDSACYLDVNVQSFATSFANIELQNGQKWCESQATQLFQSTVQGSKLIDLPNAWRLKADGLPIWSTSTIGRRAPHLWKGSNF